MAVGEHAVGPAGVIAANIVLKRGSRVDGEGLVENVATIDPLAVAELAVFGNDQRVGSAVGDGADGDGLIENHAPLGRIVAAVDAFTENTTVVDNPQVACCGRGAGRRGALERSNRLRTGASVMGTVVSLIGVDLLKQIALFQLRQNKDRPSKIELAGVGAAKGTEPFDPGRKFHECAVVVLQRQPDLAEVVAADDGSG